jgi:hypothetical protein
MARGSRHINRAYKNDKELMESYALYKDCVSYQVVQLDLGDKTSVRIFPTGYHNLPYTGSLMEQPYRLMEYFSHFMNAERNEFYKK